MNYLDRHLTDERLGADKINKVIILKKIRDAEELDLGEKEKLFEWVDRHTSLTVKMPNPNTLR